MCHLSTVVQALRLHTSHCFQPHLNHGHASSWPCVSQMLISPGHQHRSTEVRFKSCSNMNLDLLWALCGQLRLWPDTTPACMWPQSLQVLKLGLSCYKSTHYLFRCFVSSEFTNPVVGMSIHNLCSCEKILQVFFLSCTASGGSAVVSVPSEH